MPDKKNKPCQNRECPIEAWTKQGSLNCLHSPKIVSVCKHYNPTPPPKPLKKPDLKKWYRLKTGNCTYLIVGIDDTKDSHYKLGEAWYNLDGFWEHFEEVKK